MSIHHPHLCLLPTRQDEEKRKTVVAIAALAVSYAMTSSRPNVNPFYIEPSKRGAWEDDDFGVDEAEMEGESLLPTRRGGAAPSWRPPPRRRHAPPRSNRRIMCIVGGVVILLLLLVSTKSSGGDSSSSENKQPSNHHNATTTTADDDRIPKPTTHNTIKPTTVPTKSPMSSPASTTSSPVAATATTTSAPTTSPITSPASSTTTNAPVVAAPTTTYTPTKSPVEISAPTTLAPHQAPAEPSDATTQSPVVMSSDTSGGQVADEIVLLGLRNSGMDWYSDKIRKCYPNHTVTTQLTRETIWFQNPPTVNDTKRRVFVFVVRNVYDWVEAMRNHPDYAPFHTQQQVDNDGQSVTTPLPWMDFVKLAWKPPGPIVPPSSDNTSTAVCQLGFTTEQVVPCTVDTSPTPINISQPTYELSPHGGNTFSNILDLRAAKIRHFVQDLPAWWNPVHNKPTIVRYETGPTMALLDFITNWTHACATNDLVYPDDMAPSESYKETEITYLLDNVDWGAEKLIGYEPREG